MRLCERRNGCEELGDSATAPNVLIPRDFVAPEVYVRPEADAVLVELVRELLEVEVGLLRGTGDREPGDSGRTSRRQRLVRAQYY